MKNEINAPILGNLLLELLYNYGFDMDYIFKEIIALLPENFIDDNVGQTTSLIDLTDPNPKLILADPLKRNVNVGRSASIAKIKVRV